MQANWRIFTNNAGKLLSSRVITMGLGLIELMIVVRDLGIDQYGILTLSVAYVTTLNQFFDLRIWETVIRFLTTFLAQKDYQKAVALLKLCLLIDSLTGILAFFIIVISAPIVASVLSKDPDMSIHIGLYASFLLVSTVDDTTTGTLRVLSKFKSLAVLRVVQKTEQVLLIFIFLWIGLGINGVLLAYILSGLADAAMKVFLSVRCFPVNILSKETQAPIICLKPYSSEIKKLLIQTNIHATLKMLTDGADVILLGALSNPSQVGYYKLAQQLISFIGRVSEPAYEVIYPQLANLWDSGRGEQIKKLVYQVSGIMASIMVPLITIFLVFDRLLIMIVAGKYMEDVSLLIRIMAPALALSFIFVWLHPLALVTQKAHWTNIARTTQGLIWIVGSFVLVPNLGSLGSAIIYLLSTIVLVTILTIKVAIPVLWRTENIVPSHQ